MDSAIQTARGRGGTGVRACLTPYLVGGSGGCPARALAGPALLLRVCVWGGGCGETRQMDSALRRARARVGRGVRVQLDPYLGGDSVGGLALGLGGPSLLLRECVLEGGRGGDVSEGQLSQQGTRVGREGRSCAAGPIPKGGERRRSCPWPCHSLPPPAGGWVGGGDVEGGTSTRKRALQGARAGREGRARAT